MTFPLNTTPRLATPPSRFSQDHISYAVKLSVHTRLYIQHPAGPCSHYGRHGEGNFYIRTLLISGKSVRHGIVTGCLVILSGVLSFATQTQPKIMGNTASAEAPRKSLKATHRLSKPKIGNHANASLPSSNGFSKSTRRLSNTEVLPLRPEVAPPLPSPLHAPSLVETGPTDAGTGFPGLEPHEYSCKPPLRSDSFPEIPAHHDRRGSTGTTVSHQAGRPAARRAHSMVVGTSDWSSYENLQAT